MKHVHYVRVLGYEVRHSFYSQPTRSRDACVVIAALDDYFYNMLLRNENITDFSIGTPKLITSDYTDRTLSLYTKWYFVRSWRDCTTDEAECLIKALAEKNLVYETRTLQMYITPIWDKPFMEDYEFTALYWIDKEKFPVNVNGTIMPLSEFRNYKFEPDDKVLLHWDNIGCNYGSGTVGADQVLNFIDNYLFGEQQMKSENMHKFQGRFLNNEYHGWNFDEFGALEVRIRKDEVSVHKAYES